MQSDFLSPKEAAFRPVWLFFLVAFFFVFLPACEIEDPITSNEDFQDPVGALDLSWEFEGAGSPSTVLVDISDHNNYEFMASHNIAFIDSLPLGSYRISGIARNASSEITHLANERSFSISSPETVSMQLVFESQVVLAPILDSPHDCINSAVRKG